MDKFTVKIINEFGRFFFEEIEAETMQEAIVKTREKYSCDKYDISIEFSSLDSLPKCQYCGREIVPMAHHCYTLRANK